MGLSKTYGGVGGAAATLTMQGFNDMEPWGCPGELASSTLAPAPGESPDPTPRRNQAQHRGSPVTGLVLPSARQRPSWGPVLRPHPEAQPSCSCPHPDFAHQPFSACCEGRGLTMLASSHCWLQGFPEHFHFIPNSVSPLPGHYCLWQLSLDKPSVVLKTWLSAARCRGWAAAALHRSRAPGRLLFSGEILTPLHWSSAMNQWHIFLHNVSSKLAVRGQSWASVLLLNSCKVSVMHLAPITVSCTCHKTLSSPSEFITHVSCSSSSHFAFSQIWAL